MRAFRRLIGGATLLLAVLLPLAVPRPALGEEPIRVLVLGEQHGTLAARTKVELESMGCQVVLPPRRRAATREELAREFGASAIVEIDLDNAVHVWILDPGATQARSVDVLRAPSEDITALRSVEIVRAALEHRSEPPPAGAGSNAGLRTQQSPDVEPDVFRRFVTGYGVSMLVPWDGETSAAWSLLLDARYRFGPHFALSASATIPFVVARWSSSEISAWMMGIGPLHTWETPQKLWALHVGYGLGGALLHIGGGPNSGQADYLTAYPFAKVALGMRWTSSMSLSFQGLLAYAIPRQSFSDCCRYTIWGQPLTTLSTTLEIGF